MSSRATFLLVAFGLSSPASAQSASVWRDSAYRLAAIVREFRDSVDRADASMSVLGQRDGLVVSATPRLAPIALRTLDRFDAMRLHWFGDARPGRNGFRIVLRGFDDYRGPADPHESIMIAGAPDTGYAPRVSPMLRRSALGDPDSAAREMLHQFGGILLTTAPASIRRWIPAGLALILPDAARREQAMVALVTGEGPAQRDCARGDLDACGSALGLRTPRGDAGGRYYPLARADLLLFALDLGGPAAWDRLTDTPDAPVADQLSRAAAMPMDTLLARWRRSLLAIQPQRGPLELPATVLIFGWIVVLLLGTLGVARWA